MPVKIYEPIKSPDIEAIRWFDDNWDEVNQFMGNNLIGESFLFTPPLNQKKKETLAVYHQKNLCDSEGRQNVLFKTVYTEKSTDCLYYGDWLYHKIGEPFLHCCSDTFFNRSYKEKE